MLVDICSMQRRKYTNWNVSATSIKKAYVHLKSFKDHFSLRLIKGFSPPLAKWFGYSGMPLDVSDPLTAHYSVFTPFDPCTV